ncbi:MAG: helix-turn-helix transcriptional regulator [Oscillospiraceae bacterium]|nr:helix-turn-helix transcriptional regulator [Oscillospiraceae bacterium]
MEFKEKIKHLRQTQGATLEEIGNIVGVSKATVKRWESGEIANLRRDKIYKLAQALHTTPAYLMGWEDDDPTRSEWNDYLFRQIERAKQEGQVVDLNIDKRLISAFEQLNTEGQEKLIDYADDLVRSGKYKKSYPCALDQRQA